MACPQCDLVYAISPPVDNFQLYNQDYFGGENTHAGYANYAAEFKSHQETFSRRLLEAEFRLGKKGRLLDYGCAFGHLGKTAKNQGWDVLATDISYDAIRVAKDQHGLEAFVSDLTQPPVKEQAFDLVTLYDVIEHLPDPHLVLEKIRPAIKNHGLLHITTPDVTSWSARLMGKSWYHYKAQEHLLYFSPKTLRDVLVRSGFEVIEVRSAPSHMTVYDVLVRLKVYSEFLTNLALGFLGFFGLQNKVVKIHIGEMQAWARPTQSAAASSSSPSKSVLCCPDCKGELQSSAKELTCQSCDAIYAIEKGVPVLLPSKKRTATAA